MGNGISYRAGYKYQLAEDYSIETELIGAADIHIPRACHLRADGLLTIREGYSWDGPSGPAVDTTNFLRGSLVHDALYQLIRAGLLPAHEKQRADALLRTMCREDGMSGVRAWWVWVGVAQFAGGAVRPSGERAVLAAP